MISYNRYNFFHKYYYSYFLIFYFNLIIYKIRLLYILRTSTKIIKTSVKEKILSWSPNNEHLNNVPINGYTSVQVAVQFVKVNARRYIHV